MADVFLDQHFFTDHPNRRYRVRPGWAVRRRGRETFLRCRLAGNYSADPGERACEALWWRAAYPALQAADRAKLAKAARKSGGR